MDWLRNRICLPRVEPEVEEESEDDIEYVEEADPLPEQVYHDAIRHYLDAQISSFDLLDTRSSQIFSVGSVALPLTFALLNLGTNSLDIPTGAKWTLLAGLGVYLLLLVCVSIAGAVRGLQYRPDGKALREYSEELPGAALLRWIANEYEESTTRNKRSLKFKSWWIGAATFPLYIEGALLAVAALWTLDLIGKLLPFAERVLP